MLAICEATVTHTHTETDMNMSILASWRNLRMRQHHEDATAKTKRTTGPLLLRTGSLRTEGSQARAAKKVSLLHVRMCAEGSELLRTLESNTPCRPERSERKRAAHAESLDHGGSSSSATFELPRRKFSLA